MRRIFRRNGTLRRHEYRYRDKTAGGTARCLSRMIHLAKIGRLRYIRGVTFTNKYGVAQVAVIVRGTEGYVRLEGVNWGYSGEGPRGLRELFERYRIPSSLAAHIAHCIPDAGNKTVPNKLVEYWRLTVDEHHESFDFRRYDEKTEKLVEHRKATVQFTEVPVEEPQQELFPPREVQKLLF